MIKLTCIAHAAHHLICTGGIHGWTFDTVLIAWAGIFSILIFIISTVTLVVADSRRLR